MIIIDEQSVIPYLREQGVLEDGTSARAEQLAGGYINQVFRVVSAERELVVKQALEQSQRTILHADIERARVEVAAMRAIQAFLHDHAPTPVVLHEDPQNFICVMTAAPRDAVLYHDELLAGRAHPRAARALGVYAAQLHEATRGDADLANEFSANPGFALRDQSIRSAAATTPDLAVYIETLLDRNLQLRETLVDYDITPKNVLVHASGITKLDFECVQFGDPAFDVGIVLGHFVLYALARPRWAGELLGQARAFFDGYAEIVGPPPVEFVRRASEYAAVMMLGRVAGDLILDFCADSIDQTIALTRHILAQPPDEVGALLELSLLSAQTSIATR